MQNELNELRNQVRTLKRMLFGVIGLVVVGGLLAATRLETVPDVIRAKKFEVINAEGTIGGEISTDSEGVLSFRSGGLGSIFKVYNRAEKAIVSIVPNANGGVLIFHNKDGKAVAAIGADANGGLIGVKNNDGQAVAVIGSKSTGGVLDVLNKDGKSVAGIAVGSDGNGVIVTMDSKGKVTSQSP